jgi:hypothetical protein
MLFLHANTLYEQHNVCRLLLYICISLDTIIQYLHSYTHSNTSSSMHYREECMLTMSYLLLRISVRCTAVRHSLSQKLVVFIAQALLNVLLKGTVQK